TKAAVISSMASVGPVMVTAGLNASAGFASLVTFAVTSIRGFGLLMACGILSALAIEMKFIPACRGLLPAPHPENAPSRGEARWLDAVLRRIGVWVVERPYAVLVAAAAIVAVAIPGVGSVKIDNSFRALFPASSRVRRDDALVNDRFAGTSTLRL